jgi:hypothetical protein
MVNTDPKLSLIYSVFKTVASRFPKQWICDERWHQFITTHTPELLNLNITRANVNRAITSKSPAGIGEFAKGTNQSGIFMKHWKMKCPVTKTRREVYFYYVTNPGDYWRTDEQREETRLDRPIDGATPKARSKRELYDALHSMGVLDLPKYMNKISREDLVARATAKLIPIEKIPFEEGWSGKPKGLLQILWERGWVDDTRVRLYLLEARDESGEIIEEYSLRAMMESCLDFAEEETRLQQIAKEYDCIVKYTPKYHAEIAGVGIEYSWGAAKSHFRRIPLEGKRTKQLFHDAVWESLAVLSKLTVRKCARRARQYIQAYYVIEVLKQGDEDGGENGIDKVTLPMIEKLTKDFKTHRSAIDFDGKFIKDLLN